MSLHRFFIEGPLPDAPASDWPVPLGRRDAHHLAVVLRMKAGDRVVLADTSRRQAEAVLRSVGPDGVTADVEAPVAATVGPRVGLAQGLARRERMETAVEKATELGAAEIVPVRFARSVVKLDREKGADRTDRWRRIVLAAAKQSQRAEAPVVLEPVGVAGLIEIASAYDVVLVPWEETVGGGAGRAGAPGIPEALAAAGAGPETSVLVVIGPEGGLETHEVERLVRDAGGVVCGMGETVLRTETAAIVALALAIHTLGGLGRRARA
jgi:16S rRNA (uracil1498-N3)-methyltransferase